MREHTNTHGVGEEEHLTRRCQSKQDVVSKMDPQQQGRRLKAFFFFGLVTGNVSTMSFHHTTRDVNDDKQLLRLRQKQGSSRFSQSGYIRMQPEQTVMIRSAK